MSDRSSGIGARLLILCWLIAIIGGFFASLVMSLLAFRDGTTMSGIVLRCDCDRVRRTLLSDICFTRRFADITGFSARGRPWLQRCFAVSVVTVSV